MIPQILVKEAIKQQANIGRQYDSQGKHSHYFLRLPCGWTIYRHSVSGMLALLRHRGGYQA